MLVPIIISAIATGVLMSCVFIIYERNNPSATLAWLLSMILFPFVGLFIYFMFGRRRLKTRVRLLRAIRAEVGDIRRKLDFEGAFKAALSSPGAERHEDLMKLAYRFPGFPPTTGNKVEVQFNADNAYPAILSSIAEAKHHIHALYYILNPDDAGQAFRDALVEKARQGVEVRLLYDDIGSWETQPAFFDPLVEAGGKVHEYRPVHFSRFRTIYANFRNHRKIVVVDGETAFTGGINIGDEYLGKDPSTGFWRDTNIKLTGPAASHLQLVFAEDWYYATGELLTSSYVSHTSPNGGGGSVTQIVPSGPDRDMQQVEHMFFTAITSARKTLYIATPYFIPDESVQTAIIAAALRGVDVRLLVPKKADKLIIHYANRSYYREALAAGVRIYEYNKGFMHEKLLTADGEVGIVGTANMDLRSFRLNFEVCAVCYDSSVAGELDRQFMLDLGDSSRVHMSSFMKRPHIDKFLENMARLTSPLL